MQIIDICMFFSVYVRCRQYEGVRGIERGIKVATIEGVGSVAAVSSIGSAIELLSNDDWKEKFLMIEVMQMRASCEEYITGIVWNIIDDVPLVTIYF